MYLIEMVYVVVYSTRRIANGLAVQLYRELAETMTNTIYLRHVIYDVIPENHTTMQIVLC